MDNEMKLVSGEDIETIQVTYDTLMALVDAILPRTPVLAEIYGEIQFYGALDFYTDEYMYMMLNSYTVPLAVMVAELLNAGAKNFLKLENTGEQPLTDKPISFYSILSPEDRLIVLSELENNQDIYADLLISAVYPGWLEVTNSLNRYTMLGYYSEWYGYGTTRLLSPNNRVLESYPLSWEQVRYPGPTFSHQNEVNQYYTIRKINV